MFKFSLNKHFIKNFFFASTTLFLGSSFTYRKYKTAFLLNEKNSLPYYSRREVMDHSTVEKRIWITFRDGVYDVTDWMSVHPGGEEKIMMIAGGALDSFWEMYSFHKTEETISLLEKFRVGNLNKEDVIDPKDLPNFDKLTNEVIIRSPYLKKLLSFPYCAECPSDKLIQHFYTPNEYFFVRNHNPVPINIKIEDYRVKLVNQLTGKKMKFSVDELKRKYKRHSVEAITMCTGNRRSHMNKPQPTKGLAWETGAIANGVWDGVLLRDILTEMRFSKENVKDLHLVVNGMDKDLQGFCYSVSIPLEVAFSEEIDVILAYSYNGGEIPYEHGYPLRLIVPGYVGVRSVKWIKSIEISDHESTGPFQQRDYKIIPKGVDWEKTDMSKIPALMKHVVNSVIVEPRNDITIKSSDGIIVKGWAIGYFGAKIKKIEISLDQGKTWSKVNNLKFNPNEKGKVFGWTLWEYPIQTSNLKGEVDIWVRAEDEEDNTQPLSCEEIWNVRGLMNNAVHKVKVNIL